MLETAACWVLAERVFIYRVMGVERDRGGGYAYLACPSGAPDRSPRAG